MDANDTAGIGLRAFDINLTSTSVAPGQSLTLSAGQSVKVQSGAAVRTVRGGLVNPNSHNTTAVTAVGAFVSVPGSATGPADNTVFAK